MNAEQLTAYKTLDAKAFFRDWWNNYITVERIAEDYGISAMRAANLITIGRSLHNANAEKLKAEEPTQ